MDEAVDPNARLTIGISFGNSYSSIACTRGGDARVIANEEGDRQIPTVISYVDGEELHGTQAKAQLVRNAGNTVAGFRDYVGKNFDSIDPTPSAASAKPLAQDSTLIFEIQDGADGEAHKVTISEITARHFRRLKSSASDYLGRSVTSAVIAVPTDFTDVQKNALVHSAKEADLEVLQIVTEPVVALLASDRKSSPVDRPADKITVVADLGGIRSDAAVISTRGGMYSVLSTSHEYSLGGRTLDEVLIDFFSKEFMKKHKDAGDPRQHARGMAKLRLEAESTKKSLSIGNTANFNVESLLEGIDFSATVNRTRYDLLSGKVFARFTQLILDVVKKAGLDVLDVDEVLLAGGSAHTPRIASNVAATFPESTRIVSPSTQAETVNPSELIARGAALQAELIEGFDSEDVEQSTHPALTVTPHLAKTVGIVVLGGEGAEEFKPVILAETPLPVRRTMTFINASDTATGASLRLCEGERDIKVTKPEPKSKANDGDKAAGEDGSDDEEDDSEEEEETREKVWRVGTVLGELALKDVRKGVKVTAQITISADLGVSISATEVGKTGVRGSIEGAAQAMNGSAH
ncbi:MAG: hypothetical protein Q9162_003297 [Coniocarpon cinnabarinum]